jgi:GTPase SAR1 family protein
MFVIRLHLPRRVQTLEGAIIDIEWGVSPAFSFCGKIEDLQSSGSGPFSMEMFSQDNCISLCIAGDEATVMNVAGNIYGYNSDLEVHQIPDYTEQWTESTLVAGADLYLELPDIYPLQDWKPFAWSSLTPVLTALGRIAETDTALVQVLDRPISDSNMLQIERFITRLIDRIVRIFRPRQWLRTKGEHKSHESIQKKGLSSLHWVNYRISTHTELPKNATSQQIREARARLKRNIIMIANAAKVYNTTHDNRFRLGPILFGSGIKKKVQERRFHAPYKLCNEEVATLWHPPYVTTLPNTARVLAKKLAPPRLLPTTAGDPQVSFFGRTNYRQQREDFGIRRFDRRRHLYLVGKSGTGKSCLLELLVKSDIEQGYGCAVLDPHGDLVDDILRFIPKHRINDVVIFDPSDINHPPSFNPMIPIRPDQKMRVALGFLDTFKRVVGSAWSERMDYVLRYAMIALLNVPGTSIVSLRRLLSDDDFRREVVKRSNDESVKRFWEVEFPANRAEFEAGPISQLLNKLDELLATDMVRNILGQPLNTFDFRDFIDSRKIVLCKVSKGVLGAENSALLGSLIIWKIYEAALSRADQAESSRQDFYFYIDEFQNFATSSFGEILSESRKYRLCLTFANQFLGQLPAGVSDTVFGNIANLISFRVGSQDAGAVANELKPNISADDLLNLGLRQFYTKMSVDGEVQEVFSGVTLDVKKPHPSDAFVSECIAHSRRNYALPLAQAEEQLALSEIMSPRAIGGV